MKVQRRPYMTIHLDKNVIKAGGNDTAVLTGAPKGVGFVVEALGEVIFDGDLPDGEIEIGIPTPVTYTITLRKWPWRDVRVNIQAVP